MAEKEKKPEQVPEEKVPQKTPGTTCSACGAPIPEGADACPACGVPVGTKKEPKEKVMAEMVDLSEFNALKETMATFQEEYAASQTALVELQGKYAEADAQRKVLSESNASLAEQQAVLVELNNMMRLHEKVTDFMRLGDSRIIAPAYEEQIIGVLLLTENIEEEQKILDLLKSLATGEATVPIGELGTGNGPGPLVEGAKVGRKLLSEKAFKYAKDNDVSYKEALYELSRREESK